MQTVPTLLELRWLGDLRLLCLCLLLCAECRLPDDGALRGDRRDRGSREFWKVAFGRVVDQEDSSPRGVL